MKLIFNIIYFRMLYFHFLISALAKNFQFLTDTSMCYKWIVFFVSVGNQNTSQNFLREGNRTPVVCCCFGCCAVLVKLLPLYDTSHYTKQSSAILQILVRLHKVRSVLILITVLNHACTRVVHSLYSYIDSIRKFLLKYKLRGIERKR